LNSWQAAVFGLLLAVLAVLLAVWWRQQTFRWLIVVLICLVGAPLLSWWSGLAFEVADYRAGCDGLCSGYRGAPVPFFRGQAAGSDFLPGLFLVNCLVYLVLLLGWSAIMRAVLRSPLSRGGKKGRVWWQTIGGLVMLVIQFGLSPLYLPPPEAHVRGDPQRIAINAGREVYLYDELASAPVLRVGLEDVRPRPEPQSNGTSPQSNGTSPQSNGTSRAASPRDDHPGMRVCLRIYTYFYLPIGHMYLDMTPEGVHSNHGGVVSLEQSCWE
jgi:hypothetical protein